MMAMFKSQKERMVGGCKRQMATLTEEGSMGTKQCGDQEGREKEGKKWEVLLNDDWETIHGGNN